MALHCPLGGGRWWQSCQLACAAEGFSLSQDHRQNVPERGDKQDGQADDWVPKSQWHPSHTLARQECSCNSRDLRSRRTPSTTLKVCDFPPTPLLCISVAHAVNFLICGMSVSAEAVDKPVL